MGPLYRQEVTEDPMIDRVPAAAAAAALCLTITRSCFNAKLM